MEIKDYKAPKAKVVEVNVQNVLCQTSTEKFEMNSNSYEDSDWD